MWTAHMAAAERPRAASDRLYLVFVGLLLLCFVFGRLPFWWNWWWRRFDGRTVSGQLSKDGLLVDGQSATISWSEFTEVRVSDTAAFLVAGKGWGWPVHKSMFAFESDWQEFIRILRTSKLKLRFLNEPL